MSVYLQEPTMSIWKWAHWGYSWKIILFSTFGIEVSIKDPQISLVKLK